MFGFKKKNKIPEFVLYKEEEIELLKQIVEDFKKDLVLAKVQEYVFGLEVIKPTHMGKDKAIENVGIYQKRIQYLKENIQAVKMYAEEHDLDLYEKF